MITFREFMNPGALQNTASLGFGNQIFGVDHIPTIPTPTLDIPTRSVEGTIYKIYYTENPISIHLKDGTTWKLTKKQWEYLKSVGKVPSEGSRVSLEYFLDGTLKSVNVIK